MIPNFEFCGPMGHCPLCLKPMPSCNGMWAGSPRSMIGVNWDITSDRKQAETQLKDLTERLGLAIEAADMGIWEWDLVKDRLHWDQRMFALYNLQPDTFGNINQSWRSRVHPDDLPAVEAIAAKCAEKLRTL